MKLLTIAAIGAALAILPGAALGASRTFELETFTRIDIGSGLDAIVTVTPGAVASVVAESSDQDELDELVLEVEDGVLRASTEWDLFSLFDFAERRTVLTITVPDLTGANANSGSDVKISGMTGGELVIESSSGSDLEVTAATGASYRIDVSSGADLRIDGACETAQISVSSGANLRAENLLCTSVEVNASSGANADVHASGRLDAEASSGADITVHGKPTSTKVDSSSGADIEIRG